MDQRLKGILETFLFHIDSLNDQLMRLSRSEQFLYSDECADLIDHIRETCLCGMQHMRTLENRLYKTRPEPANTPPTKKREIDETSV